MTRSPQALTRVHDLAVRGERSVEYRHKACVDSGKPVGVVGGAVDIPGEAKLKAEEIARRGREIYERAIRSEEFDREHDGEFLVVDATTGGYALGRDDDEAFDRMEEENPEGLFYLMRIGKKAAHRIGAVARPPLS